MFLPPLRSITKGPGLSWKGSLFFCLGHLEDFQGLQDAFILFIKSAHTLHQPDLLNSKSLTSAGLSLGGKEVFCAHAAQSEL